MSNGEPVTGNCLCGSVGYRITGKISGIVICHCSMCRKAAGGIAGAFFVANRAELKWRGEETLIDFESSPGLTRRFCGKCGTAMTGANVSLPDDTVILAASTLDQQVAAGVIAQENWHSRAPWYDSIKKAPLYEGAFPDWDDLKP